MNNIFAKVKGHRNKPYFKLISDDTLFDDLNINVNSCVNYNPDHNIDEDSWFMIESFSTCEFCPEIFKTAFDSKDWDDLTKDQFSKISFIFANQGDNFYFQNITPSLFIHRRFLKFGEVAEIEQSDTRLIINKTPDAVYYPDSDTLVFRELSHLTNIFKGIDQLYNEATKEEVEDFMHQPFIDLVNGYNEETVSKPNRKRIGLAMNTLNKMSEEQILEIHAYIQGYCDNKLIFNSETSKFKVGSDDELKFLLYGIEQRYYTTPFGQEKRLANSVIAL